MPVHFYISITLSFRFRPFSYYLVPFFIVLYILQITTTLYQYHHVNSARSPSFSSSRCPSQPRLRSQSRFSARSSFSRPYFHLATCRFHPPSPSVLESQPQQRATSRPAPRRHLFVLGTASAAWAHHRPRFIIAQAFLPLG